MYEELLKTMRFAKSKSGALAMFVLFHEGVCKEHTLASRVNVDVNMLKKIAGQLSEYNLIKTVIDSKGAIYYLLNANYYDITQCKSCSRYTTETVKCNNKKLKIKVCKNKKCKNLFMINNINKIDNVYKMTTEITVNNVKAHTKGDKELEDWTYKDFGKYIKRQFRKKFPGIKFPTSPNRVNEICNEMCSLIKGFIGSKKYVLYCKKHVDYIYKRMVNETDFSITSFSNFSAISNTVNIATNNRKKITEAGYCNTYDTDCSYYKAGECTLKRDGIKCTEEIRTYMKKKYG